jgi:structure-specific endonuclease subunit SLX1
MSSSFFVYLLQSSDQKNTYVGATVDVQRRLRQHNNLISGGARATTSKVKSKGVEWHLVCYVKGFPTWVCALQFEWRFKQLTRKLSWMKDTNPLQKRRMALEELMSLEKSTVKAIPFSEYHPEIVECC